MREKSVGSMEKSLELYFSVESEEQWPRTVSNGGQYVLYVTAKCYLLLDARMNEKTVKIHFCVTLRLRSEPQYRIYTRTVSATLAACQHGVTYIREPGSTSNGQKRAETVENASNKEVVLWSWKKATGSQDLS
jgi:hypothetical protein